MSIASQLADLAANKAAIKAAIEAKNPSIAPTDALTQWPTSIASISQSIDIPQGGWKNDGNTHFWIELKESDVPYTLMLKNDRFGTYSGTLNWGDGTSLSISNSRINNSHTYQEPGRYVVDIISDDMTYLSNGNGTETSNPYNIFNWNAYGATPVVYYAEIGTKVTQLICSFLRCTSLLSVRASNALTYIGGNTFQTCRSLKSVYAPEVTAIGANAFYASNISNLNFPKVETIESSAFKDCVALCSIVAPESLESIGDSAFENAVSLVSSDFSDSKVASFANRMFYNNSNKIIKLPSTTTSIGAMFAMYNLRIQELWVFAPTPPTLQSNSFSSSPVAIYVPSQSVETYKGASNWSSYASAIQAMPA